MKIDSIKTKDIEANESKIRFKYSIIDRIESFTIYYFEGNEWWPSIHTINCFDSSGQIKYILLKDWDGSSWRNYIIDLFYYDINGNVRTHLIKKWEKEQWENKLRITHNYNADLFLISTLTEMWVNDSWIGNSRISYYYNHELLESSLLELFLNDNWIYELITFFNYDNDGTLFSIISKRWIGVRWLNYTKIDYAYFKNPYSVIEVISSWNSEDWELTSRCLYKFNSRRYLAQSYFENFMDSLWVPANGNIKIINPDGFQMHLLTNYVHVYYASLSDILKNDENSNNFDLCQNYPNPFNPTTNIVYQIPKEGRVVIKLYNILGREIQTLVNEHKSQGRYEFTFDGSKLSSGVYIYRIISGEFTASKKFVLMK